MHEPLGRASPVVSLSSGKVVVRCLLQWGSLEIRATELLPRAGAPSQGTPVFGTCHSCRHMLWLICMAVKFGITVGHPGDLYSVGVCLSVCLQGNLWDSACFPAAEEMGCSVLESLLSPQEWYLCIVHISGWMM